MALSSSFATATRLVLSMGAAQASRAKHASDGDSLYLRLPINGDIYPNMCSLRFVAEGNGTCTFVAVQRNHQFIDRTS